MPKDEFDFDDPMEMSGMALMTEEDTSEAMTDCFVEEYMRMGFDHRQIYGLFHNPHYIGMNMVLENRGEEFVRGRITEIFNCWGRQVSWDFLENKNHTGLKPSRDEGVTIEKFTLKEKPGVSS